MIYILICTLYYFVSSQSRQEMLELKSQRDSESRKVVESLQKADIDKQKEQSE